MMHWLMEWRATTTNNSFKEILMLLYSLGWLVANKSNNNYVHIALVLFYTQVANNKSQGISVFYCC
jgi:hypothetical protein